MRRLNTKYVFEKSCDNSFTYTRGHHVCYLFIIKEISSVKFFKQQVLDLNTYHFKRTKPVGTGRPFQISFQKVRKGILDL